MFLNTSGKRKTRQLSSRVNTKVPIVGLFWEKFPEIGQASCTKMFCLKISQIFWKNWRNQNFQIFVRTQIFVDRAKPRPFQNQTSKCLAFEWVLNSNVWYLSPHCIKTSKGSVWIVYARYSYFRHLARVQIKSLNDLFCPTKSRLTYLFQLWLIYVTDGMDNCH